MNPIQKQINDLEADLAVAHKRLEELRALTAPAPEKPWEPKGGKYYLHPSGVVHVAPSRRIDCLAGSEYPTREAAESAAPYVTFFKRLCCLAAELNPSGKVGGIYGLRSSVLGNWTSHINYGEDRSVLCLFETRDAVEKAAQIMLRDGWKVPSL
jgi:hypothetical protein